MTLIILIILIILIVLTLVRFILYQKLTKLNQVGKLDTNVNLLYDDYYHTSNKKDFRKLNCNLGIVRKHFLSEPYDYDISMLDIPYNKPCHLLVVSSIDLELELELVKKYPQLEITAFSNNLFNTKFLSEKIKNSNNIQIGYSNSDDIYKEFINTDIKFDRILVRECLGNISQRSKFLKDIKNIVAENGFIYIKTFVFQPIFKDNGNQKKMAEYNRVFLQQQNLIDYWNYNFSTTQNVINDSLEHFKKVRYQEIKFLQLVYLYNFCDFVKILRIYFLQMGLRIGNLDDWFIISSLKMLVLKVYL